MDYYYVFAWREREVEGAWFSADLRHGVFSPAPVCKDSAGESCLVCLPPTPPSLTVPVNAFRKTRMFVIGRTVGRVTRELVGAGVWLGGVDHSLRGVAASKFGRNLWCVLFAEGRGGVRAVGLFSLRRLGSHRAIRPPV